MTESLILKFPYFHLVEYEQGEQMDYQARLGRQGLGASSSATGRSNMQPPGKPRQSLSRLNVDESGEQVSQAGGYRAETRATRALIDK